jgi:hypothetical protein
MAAAMGMTPLTLGMVAGAISYPPYPVTESEAAGVVMLIAMQTMWLFALPGTAILRVARARSTSILTVGMVLAILPWVAHAV